jgi:uncharacterized repeat protein (TIGR01451 family)
MPTQAFALVVEVIKQVPSSKRPAYEIVVSNPSLFTLSKVRVEDQLPLGAKLGSASPAPDMQGDRMVWSLGNLESHGQRQIRVELQPSGPVEFVPAPTATFTAGPGAQTPHVAAALVVTHTAPETVQRGAAVAIQIQVSNRGATAMTNVKLGAQLPPGLQHSAGAAIECAVGTLAPGETKTCRLDVVAAQTGRLLTELMAEADGVQPAISHLTMQVSDAALGP